MAYEKQNICNIYRSHTDGIGTHVGPAQGSDEVFGSDIQGYR